MNTDGVEDDIEIPIQGREVTMVTVDHAFGIDFWSHDAAEYRFRIGGPFHLRIAERSYELDTEEQRSKLCPALDIFGKTADRAVARADGVLELRFTDGTEILVLAHPRYEAWQVVGPAGLEIINSPGGGLAIFGQLR